jgi:hypothetical protein
MRVVVMVVGVVGVVVVERAAEVGKKESKSPLLSPIDPSNHLNTTPPQ